LELLLYGKLLKAPEALSLGLINKIVPKDELESQAMQWAEELAKKSPIAIQIAKTSFYHTEDMNYEDQFAYMNESFARLCTTDDAKEGVNAFFERRNPVWQEK
jgi:enoyl-CoA hydratase/carnithine racemase